MRKHKQKKKHNAVMYNTVTNLDLRSNIQLNEHHYTTIVHYKLRKR